jgi:hypothetical protein
MARAPNENFGGVENLEVSLSLKCEIHGDDKLLELMSKT